MEILSESYEVGVFPGTLARCWPTSQQRAESLVWSMEYGEKLLRLILWRPLLVEQLQRIDGESHAQLFYLAQSFSRVNANFRHYNSWAEECTISEIAI